MKFIFDRANESEVYEPSRKAKRHVKRYIRRGDRRLARQALAIYRKMS